MTEPTVRPPAPPPPTTRLPRLVIAAPGSGHGKTTIASGLMGALCASGLEVAPFKIGPDYIDPGYHAMATGRPGRNLDPHLCHVDQMVPLLLHGAQTPSVADVCVVEGVMGLFDGQIGGQGFASTAHVAGLIDAPVILVIDISSASRTIAAVVHGLATFDPDVRIAGVILNKAGSVRHSTEVAEALQTTGIPVLGILPRDAGVTAPSRHLGLVPAEERTDSAASLEHLSGQIAERIDLTAVLAIAHSATPLVGSPWDPAEVVSTNGTTRPVVAIAGGRAFTFRYAETEELLRAAGCEPVTFDPVRDVTLPAGTSGLYLGGGFPEMHAADLADNTTLRQDILAAIDTGLPTVAECAGLLYLCGQVDGSAMVGALEADSVMTGRLTLGYRTAVADHDHLLGVAGTRVTGHEFHRTTVEPGDGTSIGAAAAWLIAGQPAGFSADPASTGTPTLHASYLHTHWAGHPQLAQRFADAVHAYAGAGRRWTTPPAREAQIPVPATFRGKTAPDPRRGGDHDLDHHGDSDIAEGLIDLAVNVRVASPPEWLAEIVAGTIGDLAAYPRPEAATTAIATAHRVSEDRVLPTAGGAEAFTLLARATQATHPLIVHPQFTEPEAALRVAGYTPQRLVLVASDGFRLDPERVDPSADLVMIGNPTNPTSVLHPRALIAALARPGRLVVVDEAFMDAVPGETESMLGDPVPGVLVLRSLTKTWGLAGLRAGYAVGDAETIAAMRRQQQPWSVSTPALAATVACLGPDARAIAEEAARELGRRRVMLVRAMADVGLPVAGDPAAPFVLVDTTGWPGPAGWLREALRAEGFAVRRGETFPGLDANWIRMAVRDEATTAALAACLRTIASRRARRTA